MGKILFTRIVGDFQVTKLGRKPCNDVHVDLSSSVPIMGKPIDYLLHNAGLAHYISSINKYKPDFWSANRNGTLHLLKGLSRGNIIPQGMIFISTVAVYGNEQGEKVTESAECKENNPYATSKLAAERLWVAWAEARAVPYLILRLPLVVGPNPPGNLGAIAAAIRKGYYFRIGRNRAKKSIVRGDDVADVIARWFKDEKKISGVFNLTDDQDPDFYLIEMAISMGLETPIKWQLPEQVVRSFAKIGDVLQFLKLPSPINSEKLQKMTSSLTFDCNLAKEKLNWKPRSALELLMEHSTWQ